MANSNMTQNLIEQLASVFFWLGEDLVISRASKTLLKYLPDAENQKLEQLFEVQRPSATQFSDLKESAGTMVLLVDRQKRFAARGQFALDESTGNLIFVGSPWLSWITSSGQNVALRIDDFKSTDAQVDQLILLSTEQQNLRELKESAERLRIARDKAEEAFKVQSDFFAIMSHEMRTPLNGVSTALEIIDGQGLSGKNLEMLDVARASSANMKEVVDDVLNYSKLQAGGFENSPNDFDPRQTVEAAIKVVSSKAEEQGTQIASSIQENLFDAIRADESKFRQILINLVSNAVKYCHEGLIQIDLSLSEDKKCLKVGVTDNGIGIPEDVQPHIFESFWTRETNVVEQRGTGLGLNICKRLVAIMQGSISFESNSEEGTTFFLEFPIELGQNAKPSLVAESTGESKEISGHVLIVEDNKVNQQVAKSLLEQRGLSVVIAEQGAIALSKIESQKFDLVLMDISMPVMDGATATQRLRQIYSSEELPIVAMTAHVGEEQAEYFVSLGMNSVLHKPIDTALLDQELQKYLIKSEVSQ